MAINFPTENLSAGTTHSHNGKVWEWNGSSWTSGLVSSYTVTGGADKIEENDTSVECIDDGTGDRIEFKTSGTEAVQIDANRQILISGTETGDNIAKIYNSTDGLTPSTGVLGIYASSNNATPRDVRFYSGGGTANERFRIGKSGQIGVGGDVGTIGKVLTSGGPNAAATWEDASGGSTYSLHSLLSTGIELQVDGEAVPANRVFFDEGSNMSVTQTNTNPHTIEFEATPSGSANQLQYSDGTNFAGTNIKYNPSSFEGSLDFHNNSGTFGAKIACYHSTISGGSGDILFYAGTTFTFGMQIKNVGGTASGNTTYINGTLSKVGGSFKIPHPLPALKDTKDLVHSFIEGPQMDLIYRGKIDLVGGTATVNIDTKAGMTEGTFVLLNRDIQCFTSNETGWTAVKGSVSGNILTITAQDNTCTDTISWMVVGERQDDTIKALNMTDADGNLIVEPDQTPIPTPN